MVASATKIGNTRSGVVELSSGTGTENVRPQSELSAKAESKAIKAIAEYERGREGVKGR
jgi:hypothetical protein